MNTTATSAERKNGTDMTFKQLGVIRHSSSVGNEPVQSAPHSLDAPDKLCKVSRCLKNALRLLIDASSSSYFI